MKRVVSSEINYYNANSRNKSTIDCVKRSISLAFGISYDRCSSELNRFAKQYPSIYNYHHSIVFGDFIVGKGGKRLYGDFDNLTIDEFADLYDTGTYLVKCIDPSGKSKASHLVCIIDGEVYDSWDSRYWMVSTCWIVKSEPTSLLSKTVFTDDNINNIKQTISEYSNSIISKKMNWITFEISDESKLLNDTTYRLKFILTMSKTKFEELGLTGGNIEHKSFILKSNLNMSVEDNLESIISQLKYNVREYLYKFRKTFEEVEEIRKLNTKLNPSFRGDKRLLLKLPEAIHSKVTELLDRRSMWLGDIYMCMEADKDDPLYQQDPEVSFWCESLKELNNSIQKYLKDYTRP